MLNLNYKTILKVALPLMASSFIQSIVLLTDAAFISRYDKTSLSFDVVGNGGLIYITMFMALVGLSDGSQIIIARRIGQNNTNAIGRIFGTSIIAHLSLALLLFLFIQLVMPDFLMSYSKHKDLGRLQLDFISIRSYALFFALFTLSIQAFFLANGKTWVVLIAAFINASSNIVLDYVLIFGKFGLPEMGLKGAAWANTISDGLAMTFLVIFIIFSAERKTMQLFKHFSFNFKSFLELFKVGSPLMLQSFIALATWTVFFTWIEQVGKFELTVSQNIRSIYFLAFVPIFGFSATTKTYISQYIGRKEFHSLKKIQQRIQLLTILFLLFFFHGALFYPEFLINMVNPNELYSEKSAEILRFVAISIFLYGTVSVYFQTINGSGNTFASFIIEVICVGVYMLSAFLLIKVFHLDIFWIWSVEYIYFGMLGLLSISYLYFFNWQKKIV